MYIFLLLYLDLFIFLVMGQVSRFVCLNMVFEVLPTDLPVSLWVFGSRTHCVVYGNKLWWRNSAESHVNVVNSLEIYKMIIKHRSSWDGCQNTLACGKMAWKCLSGAQRMSARCIFQGAHLINFFFALFRGSGVLRYSCGSGWAAFPCIAAYLRGFNGRHVWRMDILTPEVRKRTPALYLWIIVS